MVVSKLSRASGGLSLEFVRATRRGIAVSISFALASCTTTQAQLAANPKQVPKVNLCRTYLQTPDPMFQKQLLTELAQRGISPFECHEMVQKQDQAAAALVAVALVGTAVAVCANGCTSGNTYYRPPPSNSGNCQNPWDLDARGYRCGDRAASVRPGGYGGGYFPVAPAAFPAAPAISRPAPSISNYRTYVRGPRGGCYYINGSGNKTYVDRSMC